MWLGATNRGFTPPPAGELITWTNPALNADGTTLTDLTSVNVYYGTNPEAPSQSKNVSGAATSTTISGLTTGTWYFWINVVNSNGRESSASTKFSKVIP